MTATACSILRHDIRPRFIGDLVAAYCHTCGCLFVPDHQPAGTPVPRREPVPALSVEGWAPGELVEAFGR